MKTCTALDLSKVGFVRIKGKLRIGEIYLSESLLVETSTKPEIEVVRSPAEMVFDAAGNLMDKPVEIETTA